MPVAVIAAGLVESLETRERSAGLRVPGTCCDDGTASHRTAWRMATIRAYSSPDSYEHTR